MSAQPARPALEPVAIVGLAAIMPQAPDAAAFWANLTGGVYSITDVPPQRWDPDLYYDPDPHAPDKTYSRIGGWVGDFAWDPVAWRLPVPPTVAGQMDDGQRWAVSAARAALVDAGWPDWSVDPERVAVVLGNAIGGEKHYRTNLRVDLPEVLRHLRAAPAFAALPADVRDSIVEQTRTPYLARLPEITEDSMPGELANVIAGRIANLFNFRGPNFTTDAACASGLAAMSTAVRGLQTREYDAVVTGGVDRNMGVAAFVKFCRIGALSATGTRPFDAGADGFVMGEGCALFVLKRLSDAERDGDRVYAVVLGVGGSSDGRGKGITAPNPVGQRLAVERAWEIAGADPASASCVEAHGTSTRVGDATELASLTEVFAKAGAAPGSIALGSVKSNIGHLKAAAGAAGLFKAAMSLHHKVLPPSLSFRDPNPNVDWSAVPFRVNTTLREWDAPADGGARRAGVSAFGFGGTNFHAVLEEHVPGRYAARPRVLASAEVPASPRVTAPVERRAPLRGALVVGGTDDADVVAQLTRHLAAARAGTAPAPAAPDPATAAAAVRVAVDFADAADLAAKLDKAVKAFAAGPAAAPMWKLLRSQGVFVGRGPAPKVAFLYTGQGSQYVNMLAGLRATEPVVAGTFAEADEVMTPLLGRPLSSYIFVDGTDPVAVERLERQLLQTEITQPAVLATDLALTRLLAAYGVRPDMVMGHSLGEYGALVAAGALTFSSALEAVSARGKEMAGLAMDDNGAMAAVFGPLETIERVVAESPGYVVIANINSTSQAVIGGATAAVEQAIETFQGLGVNAVRIPVSHAFHTSIVAPASVPLVATLRRLDLRPPVLPIVANVTGEFYPDGGTTEDVLAMLGRQVASPVQFVRGLRTLYDAGARVFVEVGPRKALAGFVEDVLVTAHDDVLALFTNHPKSGDVASFNAALCGLYAAGLGLDGPTAAPAAPAPSEGTVMSAPQPAVPSPAVPSAAAVAAAPADEPFAALGKALADVLAQGLRLASGSAGAVAPQPTPAAAAQGPSVMEPVVVSGAALGLPGVDRTFDDENVARILAGQQFIDSLPHRFRKRMVDMHITRLVKSEASGPSFEEISSEADVIKLAGRHAPLDVVEEFGVDAARDAALDTATRLAIGAGFDALRDAGIPLVLRYRTTTLGTRLPDRWGLPDALRDDTGVVFAAAFPGYDSFASDIERYMTDRGRREQVLALEAVRARLTGAEPACAEVDRRIADLRHQLETDPFVFDRRFLFRALSMGHSQFAEIIGARGPNTQVNAACASTTQAVAVAEDWIRAGRCRRVVIVSADDATGDALLPWITSGFLASGAAATDDVVEDAATPFDRRRHGMIVGMGAAALVVESAAAARERGVQPIAEVLGAVTANSAFHGTRLDVEHIGQVMEQVVAQAEARGVDRHAIAAETVFVSHETYTPARGGSASAEINALRSVFGADADRVVITNTKGFTGHAMGAGIEDVVAVKALETGIVPPVPNYKEPDPDLGPLNLSTGGAYPVRYALRLAAGFGSQIAMALLRWTPVPDGRHRAPSELGYAYRVVDPAVWQAWLDRVSGHPGARLEVDHRRLRVVDEQTSAPATSPAPAAPAAAPFVPAQAAPVEPPATAPVPAPPVPAAAVPAAVAGPVAEPVAQPPADPVTDAVVGIVSEMTGYPPELLALDLDLEADLGVDTVKQAEVFAGVREHFGVERDANLQLRDFPTLAHVVGWVRSKTGIAAPVGEPTAEPVAEPAAEPALPGGGDAGTDPVVDAVVGIVSEMTGYPPELLALDLDLEADLGVDTVKQAEVFAGVREHFGVERDAALQLRDFPTLAHVVGWVRSKTGIAAPAAEPVREPASRPAAGPAPEPTPEPAPEPTGAAGDPVLDAVVGIVAEMTGYPPELLDADLDLEADLGVDTVKQAEVFAGVREHFGVERDANLQLRDFPTLAHVVGWVRSKTGIAAPAAQPAAEPAAAPVAAPAPGPVPEQAVPAGDPVLDAVVGIVAEMTGYPPELLDADLDLEADLGVDTVKQAEVFGRVREHFGVERDAALQLRDFPTLAHVVGWVRSKTGIAAAGAGPVAGQPVPTAAGPAEQTGQPEQPMLRGDLAAIDALPRRVPVPVVRPVASACTATGVTLGAGTRVVLAPDAGGVAGALAKRLDRLGVTVLTLDPGSTVDEVTATLDGWLADGPVHGVYWLPALDDEGPLDALDPAGWREALRRRVKTLHATMRRLFDGAPFLVAGTRLGGFHGYDEAGATSPLGGAVTGFTKSYKKEQPDALVKAVDLPPADRRTAALADALVEETLVDPGCVEVGRPAGAQRWGVGLAVRPFPALHDGSADGDGGLTLDGGSTVVVTGAAGSIVSAITADLAAASGATFHLLDLTPAPDPADPDLQRYLTDRDGLKADLAARMKDRGERPTPVAIDRELARFERLAAALAAIRAVEAAGGTARYHSVDLTDAAAVAAVVADVRASSERVDLLLHAAGLEISRGLPAKEPREFDLVLDVKCDGWFGLLHALGDTPIGATVVFSSVAGRFGNAGQTDYAAANDLLCKVTSSLRRTRPGTRAIALDWTAWGGIGMATRGSIPKIMEAAGVEMLPPEAGIAWIRRELVSSGFRGEVVVAGRLGLMAAENDPAGGLDVAAVDVAGCGPMVGAVTGVRTTDGLVVTTTLDPAAQPFLDHHRIDGVPVLPGVMGMEAFVEAARLAARLGGVPHEVTGLEDVAFLAPVKFYRDEPRTLTVTALLRADAGGDLVADCRLEAQRVLPGAADPVTTVHFTGRVRLSTEAAPAAPDLVVDLTEPAADRALGPDAVYRLYFHGPAYQVVGGAWRTGDGATARLADPLPEDHVPAAAPLASAPRLVELCFQAAGLWEAGRQDRLALPRAVARVRWVAGPPPAPGDGALFAVATAEDAGGVFDCTVVDAQGHVVLALDGYATVPLPAPLPDDVSAPLRDVFAG